MIRIKQSVIALLALGLAGCSFNNPPRGPDVVYAPNATEAVSLQIPPGLTNVSDGEQFILPGAEPGPLSRNKLLPNITGAKYVRTGDQNWLAFNEPAETIWPVVLEFISKEKWKVEKTDPTTGLITTQWRSDGEEDGGLLKNLVSKDEIFSRVAFRFEREGTGSRLFARSMQSNGEAENNSEQWPASSHDPEEVSELLAQLLVFFGVKEQEARGILSEPQANAVTNDAYLETNARGSQLVVNKAFTPSFSDVKAAVEALSYTILLSDGSVGTLQIAKSENAEPILVSLSSLHVSAVRVQVTQSSGQRLEAAAERDILVAIQEKIG